jgi:hypothetical protein
MHPRLDKQHLIDYPKIEGSNSAKGTGREKIAMQGSHTMRVVLQYHMVEHFTWNLMIKVSEERKCQEKFI